MFVNQIHNILCKLIIERRINDRSYHLPVKSQNGEPEMKLRTWTENLRWSQERERERERNDQNQVIKIKRKEYYLMKPKSREQSSEGEGETEKEKWKKNQRWRQDLREQRTLQMSWGSRGVLRAWGRELESWDELSEVGSWEWGKEAESFERGVRLWECLGVRTLGLDFRFLAKMT